MDDQHKHIEDWLKAAAEQSVPGETGMEEKQQAWSKMAGLLDNAASAPQPEPPAPGQSPLSKSWFATGRGMLWSLTAAAAVGVTALVIHLQLNNRKNVQSKATQVVMHHRVADSLADVQADSAGKTGADNSYNAGDNTNTAGNGQGTLNNTSNTAGQLPAGQERSAGNGLAGSAGVASTPALTWWQYNAPVKGAAIRPMPLSRANRNDEPAAIAAGKAAKQEADATNRDVVNTDQPGNNTVTSGPGKTNAPAFQAAAATTFQKDNAVARQGGAQTPSGKTTGSHRTQRNADGTTEPGATDKPRAYNNDIAVKNTGGSANRPGARNNPAAGNTAPGEASQLTVAKNATAAPNTIGFRPLRTINAFSIKLPALLFATPGQRMGAAPPVLQHGNREPVTGGLALQAGFIYPFTPAVAMTDSTAASKHGNGYGFKLGAQYAFAIGPNLYLQPMLSVGYLTGWNKPFTHAAVNRYKPDSAQGVYTTDSIITRYTAKNAFIAGAGISVSYVLHRWVVSSGLSYQYARASGTRDTTETHTRTDSLAQAGYSTPAFSSGQLPGAHTLGWSLDVGYYIRPRIQVGASYQVNLLRSSGGSGFKQPLLYLQHNSLELYIRVPLQR